MDKKNRKMRITKRSFNQMRDHSDEVAIMHTAGKALLPVVSTTILHKNKD